MIMKGIKCGQYFKMSPCSKEYKAGIIVTYICNGNVYQESVIKGKTVLSPKSFTIPTISGRNFLGWSLSAGDGTVETNLLMGNTPITLYAVYKVPDKSVEIPSWWSGDAQYPGTFSTTSLSNIDMSLYYAIYFTFYGGLTQNHVGNRAYIYASVGGTSSELVSASRGWGTEDTEYETASGSRTLVFAYTTGTTNMITSTGGSGHISSTNINYYNGTLLGRTFIG